MPSYVARPHVLANKFVPGYLGDSFGLLPFVHGNPLANHFDGPFLVRLIRKEVTNMSGFPFGIEGRDPDIPSCWHSGTMRRSCCWSIPCTIRLTQKRSSLRTLRARVNPNPGGCPKTVGHVVQEFLETGADDLDLEHRWVRGSCRGVGWN